MASPWTSGDALTRIAIHQMARGRCWCAAVMEGLGYGCETVNGWHSDWFGRANQDRGRCCKLIDASWARHFGVDPAAGASNARSRSPRSPQCDAACAQRRRISGGGAGDPARQRRWDRLPARIMAQHNHAADGRNLPALGLVTLRAY